MTFGESLLTRPIYSDMVIYKAAFWQCFVIPVFVVLAVL